VDDAARTAQIPGTRDEASGERSPAETPAGGEEERDHSATPDAIFAASPSLPGPPEVSPDGGMLAFLLADESGVLQLWVSPTDGNAPRQVPVPFALVADQDPETGRVLRGPQWSPDGSTLAVTGLSEGTHRTAIWLVPVTAIAEDGSQHHDEEDRVPILLCDHPSADRSPRWSTDGTEIAFVTHRDGRDGIALAPAFGGAPAQVITLGPRDDREPVWSRDGKFLAFRRLLPEGEEHADLCVYIPEIGEVRNLTSEKSAALRHSLDWVPGRNLIVYVTLDSEWLSIAVVNADNKAGWTVTREPGDKAEPRFAANEARMLYARTEGFTTVCCERGLHATSAATIDPGEGVVRHPRWLAEKRVLYGFSAPTHPFGFLVQDNTADAERTELAPPAPISLDGFQPRQPVPFEFSVGQDEQFSGMLYQTSEQAGPAPGIIYLPDGPLAARRGEFQIEEQALAGSGMAVLTPVLHGATGFGVSVEHDLTELADREIEVNDIVEAGLAFSERDDVLADRLTLVGHGYGGTLALITAGGRPGLFRAVVAIDPILDWTIELDHTSTPWRAWVLQQYGAPLTHPDRYALRTPATFAAVIDVPLLLVCTAGAPDHRRTQLGDFTAYLDAVGVAYERVETEPGPIGLTLREVERTLHARFRPEHHPEPVPEPTNEDQPADAAPEPALVTAEEHV
ncbi:MAG: prolyl oligopeptidase family serine peptidase, partial [Chloroflexia bacterium]|nr:prolyl oligopeptidase family serine peptidase [Chloroflexia bacterium]